MIEGQEGVTWPQWQAIAVACEEHGVSSLFRSDHYLPLDGFEERPVLDAWGTVCALAATTSTLQLGTLVSPATFRHPANLAKLAVTADHISGGRVSLGLGAGWHEREHEAFGFPFGATRERMDVFAEQLEIVRGLWSATGRCASRASTSAPGRSTRSPSPGARGHRRRIGRTAQRAARRPLRRRVQHGLRHARDVPRAPGGGRARLEGRRPVGPALLRDDRRGAGPRPRRGARSGRARSASAAASLASRRPTAGSRARRTSRRAAARAGRRGRGPA